MPFVYDETKREVVDSVSGASISPLMQVKDFHMDGSRTHRMRFWQRDLTFIFDVAYVSENIPYKRVTTGTDTERNVITATYIMEDRFREALDGGCKAAGWPQLRGSPYEIYRNLARDGMFAFTTRGGKELKYYPEVTVEFLPSVAEFIAKYPLPQKTKSNR